MHIHPDSTIMKTLIDAQWENHSITAAVIDSSGEILSIGTTTVSTASDPTAHAEINAIREACTLINNPKLPKGCWLYSTFEPCPLCSSAIIWAGIDGVVYANNPLYRGHEENWSFISCEQVLSEGAYIHKTSLVKDFMLDDIKGYFTRHIK